MAELIRMPEVLTGVEEGTIANWSVAEGDTLSVGDIVAEIETDKATVEFASEHAGVVGRILAQQGANLAVGEPLMVMLAEGEADSAVDELLSSLGIGGSGSSEATATAQAVEHEEASASNEVAEATPAAAPSDEQAQTEPAESMGGDQARRFASPIVRNLAAKEGIDISPIEGTGPGGRIVRRDLEHYLANREAAPAEAPAAAPAAQPAATPAVAEGAKFEDQPASRMRQTIARRLTESKTTIPHFYLVAECKVDELLALRKQVNESGSSKISVNDFVLKAIAGALTDVPAANAIWLGDTIRQFHEVDIAMAVATEGGLLTPVIRGVDSMSLSSLSAQTKALAERARDKKLAPHELEGGAFSVSNLGMFGTREFSAIINPPQSGILAVGAIRKAPVVNANDELEVASVMNVTLSADHRVVDGAVAAELLEAFKRRIEAPLSILI